jgi:hypothetical protein
MYSYNSVIFLFRHFIKFSCLNCFVVESNLKQGLKTLDYVVRTEIHASRGCMCHEFSQFLEIYVAKFSRHPHRYLYLLKKKFFRLNLYKNLKSILTVCKVSADSSIREKYEKVSIVSLHYIQDKFIKIVIS